MAQTRRRRRRKHRGTQAGTVDRRARGRPRNRREARARARRQQEDRRWIAPTWRGAINRALIASGVFFAILVLVFGRPLAASLAIGLFMLPMYAVIGYYVDRFFYTRRIAKRDRERAGG